MARGKKQPRRPEKAANKGSETSDRAKVGWENGQQVKPPPVANVKINEADTHNKPFTTEVLDRTVIAIPLLEDFRKELEQLKEDPTRDPKIYPVIIDINLEYHFGRSGARACVIEMINTLLKTHNIDPAK